MKVTITVIKADVGSIAGHVEPDSRMEEAVRKKLESAKGVNIIDYRVHHVGDDIGILMTHTKGINSETIHKLAWDSFLQATEIAKSFGLYGAGQDLLKDAFSGNVKGLGPGVAEMEIEERPGETVIWIQADKTEPGAFNLPLYMMFADPMHNSGLILSPKMFKGFRFHILDVEEVSKDKIIELNAPEDLYDIVALIRNNHRYVIANVYSRKTGEIAAASSTTRLSLIAGKYVGKDDPTMLIRAQGHFPATGEILSPFEVAHFVSGFMRGSHIGPLTPVPENSNISFFDGPPIVSAVGFNLRNGKITGVIDLFANRFWDIVREKAYTKALSIREQGFSGPAMLEDKELEYGGITERLERLRDRFRERG